MGHSWPVVHIAGQDRRQDQGLEGRERRHRPYLLR